MIRLSEVNTNFESNIISDYKDLTPDTYNDIKDIAEAIKGLNVVHINATPQGGGVVEILSSQVSLERSLGINSRWLYIEAPPKFFDITKQIHNLLQGKRGHLTEDDRQYYLETNKELGKSLNQFLNQLPSGIILVHDPQPLPLIQYIPKQFTSILRLHIDLSTPSSVTLDFLRPYILKYKEVIATNKSYFTCMPWLPLSKKKIISPGINPFREKNRDIDLETCKLVFGHLGINRYKPVVTQVSRFDPWKDPVGVIHAYYIAKNKIPNLQLALAGLITAKDDPEAEIVFEQVEKHSRGDNDIHLFSNPDKVLNATISNDIFINALYTASTVIIQKSIREGFGQTTTEAMWKGKAVIAGKTIGSMMQIQHNKNGVLVSSAEETAHEIVRLVKNKNLRERLGKAAKETVRNKFLIIHPLLDHLKLYSQLLK
jgi:trehalose synthase